MRTPVGDFLGGLKDLNSVELGAIALKAAMEKANVDPKLIEEVIRGNPDMAGQKSNVGRQVAIHAGCSWETVACTINQQCVSSLRASEIMYQEILPRQGRGRRIRRLREHVDYPLPRHGRTHRLQDG